ncbi:Uncharacterised protein [Vibrio cholerae]|nr:Uncharacterised protein [Vibrio cholerae]
MHRFNGCRFCGLFKGELHVLRAMLPLESVFFSFFYSLLKGVELYAILPAKVS